jgi:hypothetical protein
MKIRKFLLLAIPLLLNFFYSVAQTNFQQVNPPEIRDFSPTLQFLASPELEGRGTGKRGSIIAANYIASMMQNMGLVPYHNVHCTLKTVLSDYFQTFALPIISVSNVSIAIGGSENNPGPLQLIPGTDFKVENTIHDLSLESALVFAGYGISSPELGYNDYNGLNVKGKLVIVFDGYPGQHDTLSTAWKKFRTLAENDDYDLDKKCREAARLGATAIMVVDKNYLQSGNEKTVEFMPKTPEDTISPDPEYYLSGHLRVPTVTRILLTEKGSILLANLLKTDFRSIEQNLAQQLTFSPVAIKNSIQFNLKISSDTLLVHNVIGVIPGKDTTHTVILGAHYDHLGKRGNTIYFGSDDNASGVSGLLALAEMWTESHTIPPCNITFASWTAEEKGLIGSEYYVSTLSNPEKVKIYINMDMISRSVKEDTAGRQLSIGTRTSDEYIREIARKNNSLLLKPFVLDLWDVTGHSGSDYASFTAKNIPIMTYNTGLHDDYHTPRDIPASADLIKMSDVLKLVNGSLLGFLDSMVK